MIGIQEPRLFYAPGPVVGNLGQEAIDLANMAGLELDPWQQLTMNQAASVNPERPFFNPYTNRQELKWECFEVGVMVSRQNGKGSILEARELAGLFLWGERVIIHSAHEFATSKEAFMRIESLIEGCADLAREVKRMSRSHGEEGIELMSGQRLLFKTRTKGGGRGFTGDCLILDEAMYLVSAQVGALMPTLSARPNGQIWLTGSAGDRDSEQFGAVRARALSGKFDPSLAWLEWSIDAHTDMCPKDCDEHDDPDAVESFAKANPGLGIRISVEHVQNERRAMKHETFLQERLGVGDWPVVGEAWKIIPKSKWEARADDSSVLSADFSLAIDVTPDLGYSCIVAAGTPLSVIDEDDPITHIELTGDEYGYDHRAGTQWLVPTVIQICKARQPSYVVVDKATQAGTFWEDLEKAAEKAKVKINLISPSSREFAQACGDFYRAVCPSRGEIPALAHLGQPPLGRAVSGADKRILSDMWAWNKRTSSDDISPLVAATLAVWGHKKWLNEKQETSAPWVSYGR